jgi:formate/nitrite transporter FocA (FNT family)
MRARKDSKDLGTDHGGVSNREDKDLERRAKLRVPIIYEAVRRQGEEELRRPAASLWWSGLAAGLSISFSLLALGILKRAIPNTLWAPLLVSIGYPVGFLMVVLGRQQLFTESTLTAVLPVMVNLNPRSLMLTARLWGIVLAANLLGTLIAAVFCSLTPVLDPPLRDAMLDVSRVAMALAWWPMLFKGITAGFLMAAMVWLIPNSEGAQFQVVTLMTWLIAVGGFPHIVAGSMECFMLLINGDIHIATAIIGFAVPTLIGNVVGGTALFALISYAQVMYEI